MSAAAILLGVAGAAGGGAGAFSVTASPSSFSGGSKVLADRNFGPCMAVPVGGSGSRTYAWTVIATNSVVNITAPTSPTTSFSIGVIFDDTATAVVRCTVADTVTLATTHVDVPLEFTHYDTTLDGA